MISILGLITFLLRLTLAIQGQVVAVLPIDSFEGKSCVVHEGTNHQFHALENFENGNSAALYEAEKEEKSESEIDSLANFLHALYEAGVAKQYKNYYNPFFGNKALLGDRHLYDLFHSLKIHLS
ncbi:hypothetical protein [Algoriphagus sp.]|uniref:hypothetical protein n=1 Tax=Algoriphagus sp. TaxID=1872435 RepID=UPI00391B7374